MKGCVNTSNISYVNIVPEQKINYKWHEEDPMYIFFGLIKNPHRLNAGWGPRRESTQELLNDNYYFITDENGDVIWYKKPYVYIVMNRSTTKIYFNETYEAEEFVKSLIEKNSKIIIHE